MWRLPSWSSGGGGGGGGVLLSSHLSLPLRYFQQVPEKENPVTTVDPVVSGFSYFTLWTTNNSPGPRLFSSIIRIYEALPNSHSVC